MIKFSPPSLRSRFAVRVALAVFLSLLLPAWTLATVPGKNGRVAFQSTAGGPSHLAVVNADGAGVRPLDFSMQAGDPAWSPDATKIAFDAGKTGGLHLWVMDFFSGKSKQLTTGTVSDTDPAWSPDGTKVAFTRCSGTPVVCDVWVVNSDGTSAKNLTHAAGDDRQPAWSPDGTHIAFSTNRDGNHEIYTMNADGTSPLRLTNTPEQDGSPDYSPDGTLIVFDSLDAQGNSVIWVMNSADGTGAKMLGPGAQPAFSPDGTLIAFVMETDSNADLWVMGKDGSGGKALVATPAQEFAPSWQPINPGANVPPVADAGPDTTFTCDSAATAAKLDGTLSTDADSTPGTNDDIKLYEWWIDFGLATETFIGTGAVKDQLGLASGTYNITLQVTDSKGQTSTDEVTITIDDTTPPQISVSLDPSILWPPNHKFVTIKAKVSAFDFCGPATVVLTSVTSSEPPDATGSGHTSTDIKGADIGTDDVKFQVRAERSGKGPGRTYTATYQATDPSGNTSSASGTVVVPHDKGHGDDKGHGNGNGNGHH